MLYYAIVTVHVIVCIILVLVVLLQSGKGADLAGAFGGGATQTAFGSRGPASFLSRMTTVAAVLFMLTCIGLAKISTNTTKSEGKSILETTGKPAAKQTEQKPAANTGTPQAAPSPEEIRKIQEEYQAKQKQQAAPAPSPAPAEAKKPVK
jgi:preprotein translocase subunit SecG